MTEAEQERAAIVAALEKHFGYAPKKEDGEKWAVYRDHSLIVIHPERRPRIYRRGGGPHDYYEIEPLL